MENDDLLNDVIKTFADTIKLKIEQLRGFVPKQNKLTNPDLTGRYIEELVRGFVRRWIRHQHLLHGMFYSESLDRAQKKPMQIDGIIYDPNSGPVTLQEGNFIVVNPAFCSAVIEIKMTLGGKFPTMEKFEKRLQEIHSRYFRGVPNKHVMGIVIANDDPKTASKRKSAGDNYYNYSAGGLCPIFVLFKENGDGRYEPFYDAIEALIRAAYSNTEINTVWFH
jgi:hypothetical protein